MSNASRTAIVTGASRGIGRAIAVALAGDRFNVVVNYNSNRDAADECARQIDAAGGRAHLVQGDIGKLADHERLVSEAAGAFGGIDLLVNNAGVAPKVRADMLAMGEDSYDHVLDTNLKGPFFLTQRVANHMIESRRPGSIVNISSISAYTASVNRAEYCLAKAGIAMMTSLFAARLADHAINVYEVRPGIIATDMTSGVKDKYDKLILQDGITPIRRWGQPDDVARAVLAVARGLLPFSTGQVLDVDGGFHVQRL
jgi:NAD(P)-dependent dehydrogenase (short-subunit alcohol dehydrogenase family)